MLRFWTSKKLKAFVHQNNHLWGSETACTEYTDIYAGLYYTHKVRNKSLKSAQQKKKNGILVL